jgi:hypothetical protein
MALDAAAAPPSYLLTTGLVVSPIAFLIYLIRIKGSATDGIRVRIGSGFSIYLFAQKITVTVSKNHDSVSQRNASRLHEWGRLANEAHHLEKDQKHGKHNRRNRKGSRRRVETVSLNENGSERRTNNVANAGITRVKFEQ